MTKRKSLIYSIVSYLIALGLVFVIVVISSKKYYYGSIIKVFLLFLASAILFGFINALLHEIGHILVGKKNGFKILGFTVWFFKWTKENGKYSFSFTMIGEEAGYTDSIPMFQDDIEKRLKKMTVAGPIASLILMLISIVPIAFVGKIPFVVFCLCSMCLPISAYYFLGNILPVISEGVYNDGAVLYALKHNTDVSKVMINLLKIQSEMFNGKTPKEIDEKLYFDVPQIAEDELYFIFLLNARYNFYLDKGDDENVTKTEERLLSLSDYIPKGLNQIILSDALFNACFIKKDGNKADELMYEVEKYLNGVNTLTNIRIKLAYLALIGEDKDTLDMFYNKGIKEAKKCQIKGLSIFETKLLNEIMGKQEN